MGYLKEYSKIVVHFAQRGYYMYQINENFLKLKASYLFSTIAKKVSDYSAANPEADIIRLGIGDVTKPLVPAVVEAMKSACDEMGNAETFRGYGPEQGYAFLRDKIAKFDYVDRGIEIAADEIFVSDGAKSDCGNIVDIFGDKNVVAVCDPVYPVYVDTNVMSGRSGEGMEDGRFSSFVYLECSKENNFSPAPPSEKVDIIYLCYPNNPTGEVATRDALKAWVDYANENGAIILYDSAYEAFVTSEDIPRSIYEIEGAKTCAIEFRSYSKTAGFTGTRCGYTVVPKDLVSNGTSVNWLWLRRQTTKFNGVSYIVQKGAEAVYSAEGQAQIKENIEAYLENAKIIKAGLEEIGYECFGGVHSPYVWLKTPDNMTSWEFFDYLLEKAGIVGTPGSGFGNMGEGFFRLTAFNTKAKTIEAIERIKNL